MSKKGQKLTISLESKTKDWSGVYELIINISGKRYTYLITSEFAVRKIEQLIRRRKPGKALNVLRLFNIGKEVYNESKTFEGSSSSKGTENCEGKVS